MEREGLSRRERAAQMTSKEGNMSDHAESKGRSWTDLFKSKELLLVLRLFLGVLFIYASYDKIIHPDRFAIAVRAYNIVPLELSNLFSMMLAWSEMIAGVLLVLGIFTKKAAGTIFILLSMFIIAITISLVRGLVIDCGCFKAGDSTHPIDLWLLVRDIFLLGIAIIIIIWDKGDLSLSSKLTR